MDGRAKKLPIGIQEFEKLITGDYLYVDKTRYIYELAHGDGTSYFLSRPRRFGKSLFLSSLKAYFEGKRELFSGLDIERLEEGNEDAWQEYPVFYFDFNKKNFREASALVDVLSEHLNGWDERYGADTRDRPIEERFRILLAKANEVTGRRAVVLVDEYDKPLLENGGTNERMERDKAVFKGFFSTLKSYDGYLRFVFLTGVTKFSKVSIFSDLNHLQDITINKKFACVCGITEGELRGNADNYVKDMAAENDMLTEECYGELKKMYDGYHFHQDVEGVYNPFSVLNTLAGKEFGYWWFETGTPTFLVEKMASVNYDIRKITNGEIYASSSQLVDYRADNPNPVPLLFQTGYLTITGYDKLFRAYQMGYPNEEVKYGFLECLAPFYLNREKEPGPLDIRSIGAAVRDGDTDALRDILVSLYASLPYTTDERPVEQNFQNVAYLVFTMLGQFVRTEVHSARGRSDVVVETDDYVYIMEFKRDGTADAALAQIEDRGYALPYAADPRKLIKIGANFDSKTRILDEWKVV